MWRKDSLLFYILKCSLCFINGKWECCSRNFPIFAKVLAIRELFVRVCANHNAECLESRNTPQPFRLIRICQS